MDSVGIGCAVKCGPLVKTPHPSCIADRRGTYSDIKVHRRTQTDKEFERSSRSSTRNRQRCVTFQLGKFHGRPSCSKALPLYQQACATVPHAVGFRIGGNRLDALSAWARDRLLVSRSIEVCAQNVSLAVPASLKHQFFSVGEDQTQQRPTRGINLGYERHRLGLCRRRVYVHRIAARIET
jgi:hypothetical protein